MSTKRTRRESLSVQVLVKWVLTHSAAYCIRSENQTDKKDDIVRTNFKSTYVVVRQGRSAGPYTASQLRQLAANQQLLLDDLVCRVGTHVRTRVRKIDGLSRLVNPTGNATLSNANVDQNEKVKPASALVTALKTYRQWQASRRLLAYMSKHGKASIEIEPLLAMEIASRDEFTQSLCRLFPV